MGAHVFVVDKFSFPVHRSKGFCGVKNPRNEMTRQGLYADIKAIRKGDLIFFYHRRIDELPEEKGFRGYFKVISEPFFDNTDIEWSENKVLGSCPTCKSCYSEKGVTCLECGNKMPLITIGRWQYTTQHILSNRILIEPIEYFEKPVDDNTAYLNHTNHGMLWTMLFRKIFGPGRERSIAHILPEEAEKLIRLARRINDDSSTTFPSSPYPSTTRQAITVNIGTGGEVPYESALEAWLMENIDKEIPVLSETIPKQDMEFFGNNVLYGIGGDKIDGLVLYKRDIRYKVIAIELKRGKVGAETIEQVDRYSYWIAQLSTANAEPRPKSLLLQPLVIGYEISRDTLLISARRQDKKLTIPYPGEPCEVIIKPPILLTYEVRNRTIEFKTRRFIV